MGLRNYHLKNNNGEVVRSLQVAGNSFYAVRIKDTQRIHFILDTAELDKAGIVYDVLKEIDTKAIETKPVAITNGLTLVKNSENVIIQYEVIEKPEDQTTYPAVLKKTAIGHIGLLLIILLFSFVLNKFFTAKKTEPTLVTVFQQDRPEKQVVVDAAKHKIKKTQVTQKARVSNRTTRPTAKVTTTRTNKSRVANRPSTGSNVNNMGALAVLGGMGKQFNGSGGMNLKANTNNPGIGRGGPAARGGHERGLLGKGLVSAGIGSGGSLKGYNGYGTSGTGGGKPGYGTMRTSGSSSAYMLPLSEESLIEGGLDSDQINSVIQRNLGQVIYCYEQGLQSSPALSGRVAVKFVIGANGRVDTARISNTSLQSSKVESCIVQKLRGWQFPKPTGNVSVRVTYPFKLQRLSQG